MKVYKLEVMVIDFDGLGANGIKDVIENTTYSNRCISPEVKAIDSRDIGKWHDDHPMNIREGSNAEYERLFSKKEV